MTDDRDLPEPDLDFPARPTDAPPDPARQGPERRGVEDEDGWQAHWPGRRRADDR